MRINLNTEEIKKKADKTEFNHLNQVITNLNHKFDINFTES